MHYFLQVLKILHLVFLSLSDWKKYKLMDYAQFVDGMLRPVTTLLSKWAAPIIATVLVLYKLTMLRILTLNNQHSTRQFDVSISITFFTWDNSVNKSIQKKMLKFSNSQQKKWSQVVSSKEQFSKFNELLSDSSLLKNVWKHSYISLVLYWISLIYHFRFPSSLKGNDLFSNFSSLW